MPDKTPLTDDDGRVSLIFTSLFKNSVTLYTHENTELSSAYSNISFQEIIDENLAFITGNSQSQNDMFGSTISFKGNSSNDLVMYYAKDLTPDNDMITIATIASKKIKASFVFAVLNEILTTFADFNSKPSSSEGADGDDDLNMSPHNSNTFKLKMSEIIEGASSAPVGRYGSIDAANQEIDQVRVLMNDNIERVLQRGERIHLLVNKTDKLNNASQSFRRRTIAIKRKLWWGNMKFVVIMSVCALILLYFVGGEFCGFPIYQQCFRHD